MPRECELTSFVKSIKRVLIDTDILLTKSTYLTDLSLRMSLLFQNSYQTIINEILYRIKE